METTAFQVIETEITGMVQGWTDTPDDTGIAVRVYTMFLESLPLTLWLRFEEFQGKYPLPISYISGNMEFGIWIPFLLYLKILYWDEVTILSQSLIVTTRLEARS